MTLTPHPTLQQSRSDKGTMNPPPETPAITATAAIQSTRLALREAGIDEAPLEAEVLVRHVTGIDRAALYANPDRTITDAESQRLAALLARRLQREPLPYIMGHWEFYGLDYIVNKSVLIPRPETETLVEEALITALPMAQENQHITIVDVGTGSGCVAISLAKRLPHASVVATDVSADALAVARQNVEQHNAQSQVQLVECDLLSGVEGPIDIIVSNPPYIPDGDISTLQPEVADYEPQVALVGGTDGLAIIRRLLEQASKVLSPNGAVMLEFNPPQSEALLSIARSIWPDAEPRVVKDLAGLDRVLVVELEGRSIA
jgi:release factor glutamine methyltransferase